MTEPPAQLEYAPPVQLYRRRWFRRALVAGALMLLLGWGWLTVPRYWRNLQEASLHRRWMSYAQPPTLIVFEPPGAKAKELWQPGSDYLMRPGGVFHASNVPGLPGEAVFLHGRRRPDGQRRIVWLRLGYVRTDRLRLRLEAHVTVPATLARPGGRSATVSHALPEDAAANPPRLYAGQPDPSDESRFTIRYKFPDRAGTIRGKLNDDDSIDLEFVDDPPK